MLTNQLSTITWDTLQILDREISFFVAARTKTSGSSDYFWWADDKYVPFDTTTKKFSNEKSAGNCVQVTLNNKDIKLPYFVYSYTPCSNPQYYISQRLGSGK